jgi:hypothetical protein
MDDAATFLADLDSGLCPECHQPVQDYRQVGRCTYAKPCGHRLWQGSAPIREKPRLPLKWDDGYCRCCGSKGCDCPALCACEQPTLHCTAHHQESEG